LPASLLALLLASLSLRSCYLPLLLHQLRS
jgi:hypothetical protein